MRENSENQSLLRVERHCNFFSLFPIGKQELFSQVINRECLSHLSQNLFYPPREIHSAYYYWILFDEMGILYSTNKRRYKIKDGEQVIKILNTEFHLMETLDVFIHILMGIEFSRIIIKQFFLI